MTDLKQDEREATADDKHVVAMTTRLVEEFGGTTDELEDRVRSEFSRWENVRVSQFVPVFVERTLRDELRRR
jgi:hypothetical protein